MLPGVFLLPDLVLRRRRGGVGGDVGWKEESDELSP